MVEEIGGGYYDEYEDSLFISKKKYKKNLQWKSKKEKRDEVIDKLLESDNYFIRKWDKLKKNIGSWMKW